MRPTDPTIHCPSKRVMNCAAVCATALAASCLAWPSTLWAQPPGGSNLPTAVISSSGNSSSGNLSSGAEPAEIYRAVATDHPSTPPQPQWIAGGNTGNLRPQSTSAPAARGQSPISPSRVGLASTSGDIQHIPLAPPSERLRDEKPKGTASTLQMLVSIISSLLLVVGLFLGVAWCYRKTLGTTLAGGLPKQVVNVLGRTSISARQQMVLVRFGSKLLLVSVIQGEARTLGRDYGSARS